jgi:hypothetical protein
MLTKKTGLRNLTRRRLGSQSKRQNSLASGQFSGYIEKAFLNFRDGAIRWQEFVQFVVRNQWQVIT